MSKALLQRPPLPNCETQILSDRCPRRGNHGGQAHGKQ